MINRKQWDPNRRFVVTVGSKWERTSTLHRNNKWTVIKLWKFEQGSGRELLAVTIEQGKSVRHMSQARLLNTMREVS
jgi:hypothetical protein